MAVNQTSDKPVKICGVEKSGNFSIPTNMRYFFHLFFPQLNFVCNINPPCCQQNWYFGDDLVDFMCENLMLTQIIYQHDDDAAPLLVAFLLSISRSLPNNKIELIRVE